MCTGLIFCGDSEKSVGLHLQRHWQETSKDALSLLSQSLNACPPFWLLLLSKSWLCAKPTSTQLPLTTVAHPTSPSSVYLSYLVALTFHCLTSSLRTNLVFPQTRAAWRQVWALHFWFLLRSVSLQSTAHTYWEVSNARIRVHLFRKQWFRLFSDSSRAPN